MLIMTSAVSLLIGYISTVFREHKLSMQMMPAIVEMAGTV